MLSSHLCPLLWTQSGGLSNTPGHEQRHCASQTLVNFHHPLIKMIYIFYNKMEQCLSVLPVDESPACFQMSCRPLLCIVLQLRLVVFGSKPKDISSKRFQNPYVYGSVDPIGPVGPIHPIWFAWFSIRIRICLFIWGLDMKLCDEKCNHMQMSRYFSWGYGV